MNNADFPAMPLTGDAYQDFAEHDPSRNDSSYNPECQGLTKREQFCLQMGVPETGDPELDDIIRKGNKQKFAAIAMQGLLASGNLQHVAEGSGTYSELLQEELNK